MIKNTNNDKLASLNVDSKYFLFYQIWKELTDRRTMDSYQFRVMNSLNALAELIEIIDLKLNKYYTTNHNIIVSSQETISIIQNDSVLKTFYPAIYYCLLRHLGKKVETDPQLRALRYQLTYCYDVLSSQYIENVFSELENDIAMKNNDEIIKKTKILLSCCASNGWSTNALYGLADILLNSAIEKERWNSFKRRIIEATSIPYTVYIPLNLVNGSKGISKSNLAIKIHSEIIALGDTQVNIFLKEDVMQKYNLHNNELTDKEYMAFNVDAYDFYSACNKAIGKCTDILNILSFYNYIEPWDYQAVTVFVVNDEKFQNHIKIKGKQLFTTFNFLDSSTKIFKASKGIFQETNSLINKKLQATYAYANMGKASGTQEEKFMNTWVALESLCRGTTYDNIISNVLEIVPTALCARYIYRHFRNFIEDCLRCEITFSFRETDFLFTDTRSRREHVKDIINIMRNPVLYRELEDKCKINDLLLHRCKEMNKLATDSDSMFKKIEDHNDTVRKQLSRLYRIRNNIAHTGMTSTSLTRYIEHLVDYLNDFVAEVVMCSIIKKEDTPELIFEMIKDNYIAFVDLKKNTNSKDIPKVLAGLLDTGIIELTYSSEGL